MDWKKMAVAWLRGKAAEQAQNNERWPDHAKCYPSWTDRVTFCQWLADDLERDNSIASEPVRKLDGWKLVPVEPTKEMMQAGFDVRGSHLYGLTYRAMLDAAPAPPNLDCPPNVG